MDVVKDAIIDNLVLPVIVCIGSSLLLIAKHYISKLTDSIIQKNTADIAKSEATTRNHILEEIGTLVQSAVFTTMSVAWRLKDQSPSGTLTDAEIRELHDRVVDLVMKSLPASYSEEGSAVLELIGGKDKLESIIRSMVEGSVTHAKNALT